MRHRPASSAPIRCAKSTFAPSNGIGNSASCQNILASKRFCARGACPITRAATPLNCRVRPRKRVAADSCGSITIRCLETPWFPPRPAEFGQNRKAKMRMSLPGGCRPERYAAQLPPLRCSLPNSRLACAVARLSLRPSKPTGRVMNQTNDAIWLSFEALAKTCPHDDGVRMTAELASWLLEERQRLNPPAPAIIEKVVRTVTK
jgi:hypothetical protein